MAKLPPFPGTSGRRDWRTARDAMRKLLADGDDTVQVFRIMRALNVGQGPRNHARMLATAEGGRLLYRRKELAERFSNPDYIASFAPGTVGAAYRDFLGATGFTAMGLAETSRLVPGEDDIEHPYAWFGRRIRDTHDLWHVLTGYQANDHLGEAALVAFSYAQVGGLGWAFIATMASLKSLRVLKGTAFAAAVWEGYTHGRKAKWLPGEDYETLLEEPIEAARARLNILKPEKYLRAREVLAGQPNGLTPLQTQTA